MKINLSDLKTEFIYNPPGCGPHCHSATLIQTLNNDLLVVWYAYPEEEYRDAGLVFGRCPAGGTSWSNRRPILENLSYSAGNPVLFQVPDGRIGLLFVLLKGRYWNDAELFGCFSSDGGATWETPQKLWTKAGMMIRHTPVLNQEGSLLLPAYDEKTKESVILISHPPYRTWHLKQHFKGVALIQPALIQLEPGRMILLFRPTTDPKRMWRSFSSDDGRSWSAPVRTSLPVPLSGVAGFSFDGQLAAVYNHTEEHQRHPLSLSVSGDRGLSWDAPIHFDSVPHELSYPSFLFDPKTQKVHGVYTYNRRMIKYATFTTEGLSSHG